MNDIVNGSLGVVYTVGCTLLDIMIPTHLALILFITTTIIIIIIIITTTIIIITGSRRGIRSADHGVDR